MAKDGLAVDAEPKFRRTGEDVAWMEGDLSHLGEFEPYEWAEGELDDETPVEVRAGIEPAPDEARRQTE